MGLVFRCTTPTESNIDAYLDHQRDWILSPSTSSSRPMVPIYRASRLQMTSEAAREPIESAQH